MSFHVVSDPPPTLTLLLHLTHLIVSSTHTHRFSQLTQEKWEPVSLKCISHGTMRKGRFCTAIQRDMGGGGGGQMSIPLQKLSLRENGGSVLLTVDIKSDASAIPNNGYQVVDSSEFLSPGAEVRVDGKAQIIY